MSDIGFQVAIIDRLEIGGATMHGCVGRVLAHEVFLEAVRCDGLLGIPVFNGCLLTFDYPRERLVLEDGVLPPSAADPDVLPYEPWAHVPIIQVDLGERRVPCLVDSGNAGGLGIVRSLATEVSTHNPPVATGRAVTANGSVGVFKTRLRSDLLVGPHRIAEPVVSIEALASNIGNKVLQHFTVTIDQRHHRLRLVRETGDAIDSPSVFGPGFGALPADGGLEVGYVLDDSSAAQVGLRVGDLVVEIDGRAAAPMTLRDAHELFGKEAGPHTVRIRRGDETIELEIETRLLVR
jgi:S1-C subfamily serine protease